MRAGHIRGERAKYLVWEPRTVGGLPRTGVNTLLIFLLRDMALVRVLGIDKAVSARKAFALKES